EREDNGTLLPIEVQPGTGSVDPMAGFSYNYFAFPWSLYASTTLVIPTEGTSGFRASRSLRSTVSLQRHLLESLALRLSADTRVDGKAVENGGPAADSGGFIAFTSPEVLWSPTTDVTLSLFARIATVNHLDGSHREPYVLGASVAYDF